MKTKKEYTYRDFKEDTYAVDECGELVYVYEVNHKYKTLGIEEVESGISYDMVSPKLCHPATKKDVEAFYRKLTKKIKERFSRLMKAAKEDRKRILKVIKS